MDKQMLQRLCSRYKRGGHLLTLLLLTLPLHGARIELQGSCLVAGLGDKWPLYCGVPLPKGTLQDLTRTALLDHNGRLIPSQRRILARWPGSDDVRWLGIDFVGDPQAKHYFVCGDDFPAASTAPQAEAVLKLQKNASGWLISTGPALFLLPATGPLIEAAWLDHNRNNTFESDELILHSKQGELYVIDQHGRTARSGADQLEPDTITLEPDPTDESEKPLLHLALRREGWFTLPDGERLARHITRLHFYAGEPMVRLEQTLVLTRNTTPGSHFDLVRRPDKEPPIWLREAGITFEHTLRGNRTVTFADKAEDHASTFTLSLPDKTLAAFMFQEKGYYLSRMDPQTDCRYLIGSEGTGVTNILQQGERCGDWMACRSADAGLALGVRDLWQQYPKELHAAPTTLTARLWSNRSGRELDFRFETALAHWPTNWFNTALHGTYGDAYNAVLKSSKYGYAMGAAKTHELLLLLLPGTREEQTLAQHLPKLQALSQPVALLADPAWLYRSEAMSPLYPADTNHFPLAEGFMSAFFEQFCHAMEAWGDYGYLDFGARPHVWYRKRNLPGHSLDGRIVPYLYRYSPQLDYGFAAHLWRMYARSGNRKYLELAEITNRHRMDLTMVHWDEPGISHTVGSGPLYGKYRGGFSRAMNIFPWWQVTLLHTQTGTELRQLYWHYYLCDYRRAHEVATEYQELVKRLWSAGSRKPFIDTRPFATFKNLAVLYQETGDPLVLEIGRERLAALVDLTSPQGVAAEAEATGLHKYTTKIGAIERWYEATGDELAARALLRSATTYARTSLGDPHLDYYNIFARILNRAWRISGDPLFARTLLRNLELALEECYDAASGTWRAATVAPPSGVISPSNSAYQMGDLAIGLDAITQADVQGPVPLLQQRRQDRPVVAIFRKPAEHEVVFDLRGQVPLLPRVVTLSGKVVTAAAIEPFLDQLYSLEPNDAPNCFMVRIPAEVPAGDYLLDAGVGGSPWEITWSDAPGLVYYAPGGLSAHGGPAWFFKLPPATDCFEVYNAASVALSRPDGTRIAGSATASWQTIATSGSESDAFWSFKPQLNNAHFELRGIPAILTCDTNRWFMPKLTTLNLAAIGMQHDYLTEATCTVFDDESALYAAGPTPGSRGMALHKRRALTLAADRPLLAVAAGTVELWFRPDWSSIYNTKQNTIITDSDETWNIVLNYYRPHNVLFRIVPKGRDRLDLQVDVTFERGRWYHLAWQWQTDNTGQCKVELFVNGKLKGTTSGPVSQPDNPSQPGTTAPTQLLFGHHRIRPPAWGSLNGVVANLRLSNRRRYSGDFTPPSNFSPDAATTVLLPCAESLESLSGSSHRITTELLQ